MKMNDVNILPAVMDYKRLNPYSNSNDGFSDQLDLLKFVVEVHTKSIQEELGADYTLAILNDKDKVYISEMFENAKIMSKLVINIGDTVIDEDERLRIYKIARKVFDRFMWKLHALSVLNRNKKDNYLLRMVTGTDKLEKRDELEEQKRGVLDKISTFLKKDPPAQNIPVGHKY